jgi:hypothetical protein
MASNARIGKDYSNSMQRKEKGFDVMKKNRFDKPFIFIDEAHELTLQNMLLNFGKQLNEVETTEEYKGIHY